MACGFYALLSSVRGEFISSAYAIIAGMVFDALDGRVARLVHGESSFGVEFDSMADFLSFGVAPAHMMYAFILKDYGFWGYPMAFTYALCGGLRLARFNAMAHDGLGSKTHFTGLPIPGARASSRASSSFIRSSRRAARRTPGSCSWTRSRCCTAWPRS